MDKQTAGLWLIGLSMLTMSIVIAIAHLASSIKEAIWFLKSGGNLSFGSTFQELPFAVYVMIFFVVILGLTILFTKRRS